MKLFQKYPFKRIPCVKNIRIRGCYGPNAENTNQDNSDHGRISRNGLYVKTRKFP